MLLQPCSKTAPLHTSSGKKHGLRTTLPQPIHWGTGSTATLRAFGSNRGMGVGVTTCSVRSKLKGLWSGCKSACLHDFMTRGPILYGPNHTGDDICWMLLSGKGSEVSSWGVWAVCFSPRETVLGRGWYRHHLFFFPSTKQSFTGKTGIRRSNGTSRNLWYIFNAVESLFNIN